MIRATTVATALVVLITGLLPATPASDATVESVPRWLCSFLPFMCAGQ